MTKHSVLFCKFRGLKYTQNETMESDCVTLCECENSNVIEIHVNKRELMLRPRKQHVLTALSSLFIYLFHRQGEFINLSARPVS